MRYRHLICSLMVGSISGYFESISFSVDRIIIINGSHHPRRTKLFLPVRVVWSRVYAKSRMRDPQLHPPDKQLRCGDIAAKSPNICTCILHE